MTTLFITTLVIMLNGSIDTQRTAIDFETIDDCNQAKLEMSKSLDTLIHKDLIGYSLECRKEL